MMLKVNDLKKSKRCRHISKKQNSYQTRLKLDYEKALNSNVRE